MSKDAVEKVEQVETPVTEDTKSQLLRLRDLTARTGLLYEEQVLQLNLWPYVVFDIIDNTPAVDMDQRLVQFDLRLNPKKSKGKDKHLPLEKAGEVLESWVQSMLGPEWLVHVRTRLKKGGASKVTFKGTRKAEFQPVEPEAPYAPRYASRPAPDSLVDEEDLGPIIKKKEHRHG